MNTFKRPFSSKENPEKVELRKKAEEDIYPRLNLKRALDLLRKGGTKKKKKGKIVSKKSVTIRIINGAKGKAKSTYRLPKKLRKVADEFYKRNRKALGIPSKK